MASASCRSLALSPAIVPPAPPTLVKTPVRFDAAFLDRRMLEHRRWQEQRTVELATDVVREVANAIGFVAQMHERKAEHRMVGA